MLRIRGLAIGYGRGAVLDHVNLDVAAGQFVSLIGPSGSGKSSILRAITGLVPPLAGDISLDVPVSDVGFLFQDDALLPWRTARENVALGMRIRGIARRAAEQAADEWLARFGLGAFGDRFPLQLSGGQRKRVAIAQVLALEPRLLLMDEPFASLDAIVRLRVTEELLGWVERQHLTVLLVTHDLEEALALSDVVYALSHGPSATIRSRYDVAIERPRHALKSRADPRFAPLLQRLWADLSDEGTNVSPEEAQ